MWEDFNIVCTTGNWTFRNSMARIGGPQVLDQQQSPSKLVLASTYARSTQRYNANVEDTSDNGVLTRETIPAGPLNRYFFMFVTVGHPVTIRESRPLAQVTCGVMFIADPQGPFLMLKVTPPPAFDAARDSIPMLSGQGYLGNEEDYEAVVGYPSKYRLLTEDRIEDDYPSYFSVENTAIGGCASKPTLTRMVTGEGEELSVALPRDRVRRIRLRRKR